MQKAKHIIKSRPYLSMLTLVILLLGTWYMWSITHVKPPAYIFVTVEKKDISENVSVTGRVKSRTSVDLAFEIGGRISSIPVDVGSLVARGDVLARLESSGSYSDVAQARALLDVERARLTQLKNGARAEDVAVSEQSLANTKISLNNAQSSLILAVQDAYTKSDDAIRNKVDKFITNPGSDNPQLSFFLNNSALKAELEQGRKALETMLNAWSVSSSAVSVTSDLDRTSIEAEKNLKTVRDYLDRTAFALSAITTTSGLTQTTIDGYKTDISSSRVSINLSLSALSSAEDAVTSARSAVLLSESQVALKKAPALPEEVAAQMARVAQAEAAVSSAESRLDKARLVAPISGVISSINPKVGEIISMNSPVVSLMAVSNYQVEAFIPEADISKVSKDNDVKITLDAYTDQDIFDARVISVDPAETMLEGVATYKTVIAFTKEDSRVKPGMTANIEIITKTKTNALVIPLHAVKRTNGVSLVSVKNADGTVSEKEVMTGIRDAFGNVEILGVLQEGEQVVNGLQK
jgi:RND family efflux transporter MFP subunit